MNTTCYLDAKEKVFADAIMSSIDSINRFKAVQYKLREQFYIDNGNRVNIYAGDKPILVALTPEQAYYAILGIVTYKENEIME